MMKIDIRKIRPEGMDLEYEIPAESIGLTEEDYVRFISPLYVKAHLSRAKDAVLARISVKGRFTAVSSRTKIDVEKDWKSDFSLEIPVDAETLFIDLDDEIRQEVIMSLPMRVLADGEENLNDFEEAEFGEEFDEDEKDGTYEPFADLELKDPEDSEEDQ